MTFLSLQVTPVVTLDFYAIQRSIQCATDGITMSSPTPSTDTVGSSSSASTASSSDGELEQVVPSTVLAGASQGPSTKCTQCNDTYTIPKVLTCFHTFCQPCLEKILVTPDKVSCPACQTETFLSSVGVAGLMPDFAISNILEASAVDSSSLHCTGCKSKETCAVARCFDCANFLCPNCVMAHQFMHCFEGHRVLSLGELQNTKEDLKTEKPINCTKHRGEVLRFFCRTCITPICKECTMLEHSRGHEYDYLSEVGNQEVEQLQQLSEQCKVKANDLRSSSKNIEHATNRLQIHFQKAQNEVNDTYNFYRSMLEERKLEALKELDSAYNTKQVALSTTSQRMQESIEKLYVGCEFINKITGNASNTEILMYKKMLDSKLQTIIGYQPEINLSNAYDIEFVSNYQAIQVGIRNTFGYVRQTPDVQPRQPAPIARPNGFSSRSSSLTNGNLFDTGVTGDLLSAKQNFPSNSSLTTIHSADSMLSNGFSSLSNGSNPYEKWSSGGMGDIFQNGDIFSTSADPVIDLTSKLITANIYPPKSQIKRQKMIYHCKFGEFGVMEGQFTEPSGGSGQRTE